MKNSSTSLYKIWLSISALIVGLILILILFYIEKESLPFLLSKNLISTLATTQWLPSESSYGIVALVIGTFSVSVIAILICSIFAFALSLGMIIYLPKNISKTYRVFLENMSGLPSVVIGLFGLLTLAPLIGIYSPPGFGLLTASLVLCYLLLPQLTLHFCEIFNAQINDNQTAAKSLKLSKNTFIFKILWPAKKRLLTRALLLASCRALGETLAILMVAGNVVAIPHSTFASFRTINATIALEMPYAEDIHRSSLFFLGLLTFAIIMILRLSMRVLR